MADHINQMTADQRAERRAVFAAIKAEFQNVYKLASGYEADESRMPVIQSEEAFSASAAAGGGGSDMSTFAAGEQLRRFTIAQEEMNDDQELILADINEEKTAQVQHWFCIGSSG